jgi:hypothetical protein
VPAFLLGWLSKPTTVVVDAKKLVWTINISISTTALMSLFVFEDGCPGIRN